jgi:hypothetical protein
MSARTLRDFISEVKKDGLSRQNRFTVTITPPSSMVDLSGQSLQLVQLFCEQASLPGVSYSSQPVKSYGENREVVYDKNFEDITLTFLVDRRMMVKAFFDEWSNSIIDPRTRLVGFYEDYAKDIIIRVQDVSNQDVYITALYEAYPKTVGVVQLDNNSKDVMKLQVTFTYKYHLNSTQMVMGGEPQILSMLDGTIQQNISDTSAVSLQQYLGGSLSLPTSVSELYYTNFSEYQQVINDSTGVRNAVNALERQGLFSGIGGLFG